MKKKLSLLVLLCLLAACGPGDSGPPVPLGSTQALQKLADAYTGMAQSYRFSPASLVPKQRKKFVLQVFRKAGYSYQSTLAELANDKTFDAGIENHRELAKLVLFAHYGPHKVELSSLYSGEELKHIVALEKKMGRAP